MRWRVIRCRRHLSVGLIDAVIYHCVESLDLTQVVLGGCEQSRLVCSFNYDSLHLFCFCENLLFSLADPWKSSNHFAVWLFCFNLHPRVLIENLLIVVLVWFSTESLQCHHYHSHRWSYYRHQAHCNQQHLIQKLHGVIGAAHLHREYRCRSIASGLSRGSIGANCHSAYQFARTPPHHSPTDFFRATAFCDIDALHLVAANSRFSLFNYPFW